MTATNGTITASKESDSDFKSGWVKQNLIKFGYLHLSALYGLYLCFTSNVQWKTLLWTFILVRCGLVGITAGAHRLWCHRAYKAKWPLELILMIFNSIAYMDTVTGWVRVHRMHHKHTDTHGDPHNANRGLFFSQIGWLLMEEHPDVTKSRKTIYMEDIYNNPILRFQQKYAIIIIPLFSYIIPTVVPVYFWGESVNNAYHISAMLRHALTLNIGFLVNSVCHKWGTRPFDKSIKPAENTLVSLLTTGEGFHNYHHVFPFDYKASELGMTKLNAATNFINFFAAIGWAYDLKTIPDDVIISRCQRTGEGNNIWGWGDKDQTEEETKNVKLLYAEK